MEKYTGGEIVVKYLEKENVEYVFGIAGHGCMGILDAFHGSSLKYIRVHHEMVGAAAAAGYFKATHKPGILVVTVGPGMVTAIPGLAHAATDNSAVIAIAGDIPMRDWGRGASEELDIKAGGDQWTLYRPFAKRIYLVPTPERLPQILANAFNVALTGRPGPVLIDIPLDVQSERVSVDIPDPKKHRPMAKPGGEKRIIEVAVEVLAKADRPVIVAGGGALISGASPEIMKLAELIGAPIVATSAGEGIIAADHPLYAGHCGRDGTPLSNDCTREADVILAVGTRFEEYESAAWKNGVTFKIPPTKLVQIDIDPMEIGKNYPVEVGIVGDAKTVLADIVRLISVKVSHERYKESPRLKKMQKLKEEFLRSLESELKSDTVPINPYRVIKELKEAFPENGVLVVDACTQRLLALKCYLPIKQGNFFVEEGLQVIGYGVLEALGIKLGRPNQEVIALVGDGGFLLGNQVLATAVEYDVPVIWVVMNNYGYDSIRALQELYFGRDFGSIWKIQKTGEMYSPNYAKMAEDFGAMGIKVERPENIRPAIETALKSGEPCVIDISVGQMQIWRKLVTEASWKEFWPSWERTPTLK